MYVIRKGPLETVRSGALPGSGAWDSGTVSAAYAECACPGESFVEFDATLTLGSGATTNTAEIVAERSPVSRGDDWQPAEMDIVAHAAPSGGVLVCPMAAVHRELTTATAMSPSAMTWAVRAYGAQRVRVRARETGDLTHPAALVVRACPVAVGA